MLLFIRSPKNWYLTKPQFMAFFCHALFGCAFLLPTTNSWSADSPSAEQKLESIKQGLLDLALQTDVKLGSSAYLDAEGVLHETSVMSSNADIRGIRVLTYLQEAGISTSSVDANIFSNDECPGSRSNVQRQVMIKKVTSNPLNAHNVRSGDHYKSEMLDIAQSILLSGMVRSADWLPTEHINYLTKYDRYMSSRATDQANYRLDISIREKSNINLSGSTATKARQLVKSGSYHSFGFGKDLLMKGVGVTYDVLVWGNPNLPELEFNQSWPMQAWEYHVTLIDQNSNYPLWEKVMSFYYPNVERGYNKDKLPSSVKSQLKAISDTIVREATHFVDCRTEHYPLGVIAGREGKFKIYAGTIAGVNVGEQFLISTDANIITQALNMGGLSELGLAEVESVARHTAVLRHIAGPIPKGLGGISNSVAIHF